MRTDARWVGATIDDLTPETNAACSPPPAGATTWNQFVPSAFTCKPAATAADYRRWIHSLSCVYASDAVGTLAMLTALAAKDREGLMAPTGSVDACPRVDARAATPEDGRDREHHRGSLGQK